ncbi:hypothetical protein [Pseudomonas fulva]|uniref:hypothetical protein n=1 Tax=Pseudomonas fulva TaxID=47880 RepID=UPI001639B753|nr:hypothetical protein [Pseudomonas fulva]
MTEHEEDSMVAFEQSRVADLAAFYRDLAALSDATTLDDLLALEQPLLVRLRNLSPTLISKNEALALCDLTQSMIRSCAKALGCRTGVADYINATMTEAAQAFVDSPDRGPLKKWDIPYPGTVHFITSEQTIKRD